MFFRTTTTAPAGGATADVGRSTRTWSSSSSSTGRVSSSSSLSSGISSAACEHVHQEGDNNEVVGVAVGKEVKECKANLMWVLSNLDAVITAGGGDRTKGKATVALLHVHRPAKTIPFSTFLDS